MSAGAWRVATRYLLSRGVFSPEVQKVEALLRQGGFPDALDALDTLLNKTLHVRVTRHSDTANIATEWAQALDPKDHDRFLEVVQNLLAVRHILRNKAPSQLGEELTGMLHLIEEVRYEVPWIEEMMRGTEDETKHGPFTVILTANAGGHIDEALKTLDDASAKIESKFPKVLYGRVYIRKDLKAKGSFDPAPQAGGMVAGGYTAAGDFITLSLYATPTRGSIDTLIHEFGHRYHTRFLHGDDRERFIQLSTVGDVRVEEFPLSERRKFAEEWLACERAWIAGQSFSANDRISERHRLYAAGFASRDGAFADQWRKVVALKNRLWDGDESVVSAYLDAYAMSQYGGRLQVATNPKAEPLSASEYGRTSWEENFAEAFLAFVLGTALPEPLERFMRGLR